MGLFSKKSSTVTEGPKKRLSLWRVIFSLLILSGIGLGAVFGLEQWQNTTTNGSHKPWFGAYVDATATPAYAFEQLGTTTTPNAILAFIVSSPTDACSPSWGGAYTMTQAMTNLDLDRRIARLRQQGGSVAISFGGQRNHDLAINCTDDTQLIGAYKSVIDRYHIDTIDLDIEGSDLGDIGAMKRRAVAIAALQKAQRSAKKSLAVWLTLPVTPQGLAENGTNAISIMLKNGVDITGVNIMTIDYGQSLTKDVSMEQGAEMALNETHRQLGVLYKQAGITLNSASLWTKIGATPMAGQNDIAGEVFTVEDAKALNTFALAQGVGRLSLWSANRDIQCGDNYVDTQIVSDSCSGVKEDKLGFSTALSQGFTGDFAHNALATTQDPDNATQQADDPATSPYQIWKITGAYLAGTKVVWHKNVYVAKWWTQGDTPDNPVLQSWQTPWQLVGPVLPGERPIPQPTLPPGTYPVWVGATTYDVGQRVLFNGVPYQAKWWTQGDSPAAASANPDSSPWAPLTQDQVNAIVLGVQSGVPVSTSSATTASNSAK